jgi:hypothetical protein
MKRIFMVLLLICFSVIVLAQVTATMSTSPVPTSVVSAATTPPLTVWGWVKANWATVAFFLYWLLDVIIYFLPTKATGILVQIESWLKGQAVPPAIT